jgi:DeoR/GlpR family transcriptional regulator of sugar metabolism
MLAAERQRLIVEWILKEKTLSLEELQKRLKTSLMTVRRDLDHLQKGGHITRVHGGATVKKDIASHLNRFEKRKNAHSEEKDRIALCAVKDFIKENDIIILEGGTTVSAMIPYLTQFHLTVMTNGLNLVNGLVHSENIQVMCCGGTFDKEELTFIGPQAAEFFSQFRVHKCFFGADGLTLEDGVTESNQPEIEVKRAMIKCAHQRILLIDSSKIGKSSLVPAIPLEEIDIMITDKNASNDIIHTLKTMNIDIHIV